MISYNAIKKNKTLSQVLVVEAADVTPQPEAEAK